MAAFELKPTDTKPINDPQISGNFSAVRFSVPGPVLISPRRFGDHRGFFIETYAAAHFAALGLTEVYVQDNHSLSALPGTVRGIHFQAPPHAQAKLVRVLRGAIIDVAIDLRRSSATYGEHVAVELSAANAYQLYLPVGFGHAFCTTLPDTEVAYKVTDLYAPECDLNLAWNDPDLALPWPVGPDQAQLSDKDRKAPAFRDFQTCFE
jgi:dTDP-4-dehydrorhamnose 3,5-epimerase